MTALSTRTLVQHPLSAAIALKSLEIFERDGVLENVRALTPHLGGEAGRAAVAADRR